MIGREGVLETTHEMLERLEAHLRAIGQFTVHIYGIIFTHQRKLQFLPFFSFHLLMLDLTGYCKHEGKQCRGSG